MSGCTSAEPGGQLADRIFIMKSGAIGHELRVDLARPCDGAEPDFVLLRRRPLHRLGAGHRLTAAAIG
jgi:ABC-type nitrate/sulfonate/bicarbonate transport system ATPase subunit